MRAQFAKTMERIGKQDPRLVVLVGDIGAFGLREFAKQCPGRFMNAGIREQAMASAAAGMAIAGFVPVIHSITPFVVERCFEQIKDDFGYHKLPGNVVSVGAGLDYSALGCTHHSYSDIAMMKSLPGSQVFYLGSPKELDILFEKAYATGSINYFRIGGRNHSFDLKEDQIQIGKAVRVREGRDVTFVVMGPMLDAALKAADGLQGKHSAEILYVNSIKPFDAESVRASVEKTKRVIVLDDHSVYGGLGDEVRRALDNSTFSYKIRALGVKNDFVREYGSYDVVTQRAGLNWEAMRDAALSTF